MKVRFQLDEKSDTDLIDAIRKRANGGSVNNAARFLFRHWYENEKGRFSPPQGLESDAGVSEMGMSDGDLDKAFATIDDDFGNN